eukprot:8431232-Ditylum_brightwellii.AAC.1
MSTKRFWPTNLIKAIVDVIEIPLDSLVAPEFKFEITEEAAEHIFCVLNKCDKCLGKVLEAQPYYNELWYRVLPGNGFGESFFCAFKLGETENFAGKRVRMAV